MAQHCPRCDSTNIAQHTVVKNGQTINYWQCNDCGFKFGTPVVDPEVAPVPLPTAWRTASIPRED